MSDDHIELLAIGECAKRLANTSEMGLGYRIEKGEVRTVRGYGRIPVQEDELRRCFPRAYPPRLK